MREGWSYSCWHYRHVRLSFSEASFPNASTMQFIRFKIVLGEDCHLYHAFQYKMKNNYNQV
jgi:hypothetical protein